VFGVLVVIVAVVLIVKGGGNDAQPTAGTAATPAAQRTTQRTTSTPARTAAPVRKADVTVAVLNGTTVPGLARGVATALQNVGYGLGTVATASDQTRAATLVEYKDGHRAEALSVARSIKLGADVLQPVDGAAQAIAGTGADVVVIVGADQNPTQ
jgi:hypothetical protein